MNQPTVLGRLAGLLNFVPYLGPLIVAGALLLVGFGASGNPGLLFGVPMLVCTKVLLQRLDGMQHWATLMESRRAADAGP